MPRTVVLDELHLTFRIPVALPERAVRAIRRVLNSTAFTAAVRRATRAALHGRPALKPVRVVLSR
jgi:hypothetical protein